MGGRSSGDCNFESDNLSRRSQVQTVGRTKVRDTISSGFGWGIPLGYRQGGRGWHCQSFVSCSVVSQPMKQSQSEASNWLSPPVSHCKPQLRPFATSPVGAPFCDCRALHHHPRHGQTHERLQVAGFSSPDNPFDMAPLIRISLRIPDKTHYEKPTSEIFNLTSVYFSQLWCIASIRIRFTTENRPLTPLSTSLLPIQYPG